MAAPRRASPKTVMPVEVPGLWSASLSDRYEACWEQPAIKSRIRSVLASGCILVIPAGRGDRFGPGDQVVPAYDEFARVLLTPPSGPDDALSRTDHLALALAPQFEECRPPHRIGILEHQIPRDGNLRDEFGAKVIAEAACRGLGRLQGRVESLVSVVPDQRLGRHDGWPVLAEELHRPLHQPPYVPEHRRSPPKAASAKGARDGIAGQPRRDEAVKTSVKRPTSSDWRPSVVSPTLAPGM